MKININELDAKHPALTKEKKHTFYLYFQFSLQYFHIFRLYSLGRGYFYGDQNILGYQFKLIYFGIILSPVCLESLMLKKKKKTTLVLVCTINAYPVWPMALSVL